MVAKDSRVSIPHQSQFLQEARRGIMAFPEIDLFYDLLIDRIYMVMQQFYLEKPFTLFVNALPRNHEEGTRIEVPRFDEFTLIYAGINMLQKLMGKPKKGGVALSRSWELLHETRKTEMLHWSEKTGIGVEKKSKILSTENATVSSLFLSDFESSQLNLGHIHRRGMGSLRDYFAKRCEKNWIKDHPFEEAEYQILSAYFDIDQYYYLSLPLIQFGEFDGAVHIIYHKDEHDKFIDPKTDRLRKWAVGNIIKAISREYEGKILDWGLVGGNKYKRSAVNDAIDLIKGYQESNLNDPLLVELKYKEYYETHKRYIETRIKLSNEVPQLIMNQYRRIATMQILIDSYTHNISAHSLVALEGWYKQRALYQSSGKTRTDLVNIDLPLVKRDKPFDHETHQFIRFLLDKGAFWTGLTRDYSFGGKTNSLYSVLWHDFVNNPLYLGTIANTEGVLKLNINIIALGEAKPAENGIVWRKEVIEEGNLVSIDLRKFTEIREDGSDMKTSKDHDYLSGFVTKGNKFDVLKKQLQKFKCYFPGGVVGRHAFFTILENEIRNVKHYPTDILEELAIDGLTLNISIEEESYHRGTEEKPEYYKLGVWLNHPIEVTHKMITDRLYALEGDIINDNHNPKMGGVYQDKVCAAMLFNNTFVSVQDRNTERDRRFYPWIKVGFSLFNGAHPKDTVEDWEISARRYFWKKADKSVERQAFKKSREYFDQNFDKNSGFYKKFFHIWKGDDLHLHDSRGNIDDSWENLARFKFVYLPHDAYHHNFRFLREKGIVRILDKYAANVDEAYNIWLQKWLQKEGAVPKRLSYGLKPKNFGGADLIWDENKFKFVGQGSAPLLEHPDRVLQMAHPGENGGYMANNDAIRYRRHGILLQHFGKSDGLSTGQMVERDVAEIIETLATNICIFDNRVYRWVKDVSRKKMTDLKCDVFEEKRSIWNKINFEGDGFFKYHFLVIHLSFIERFLIRKGLPYGEENIDEFIEKEILKGREVPENFFVVITSGRGRRQWQATLEQDKNKHYLSFVTFRPVESLVGAVEQAIMRADDFDMKYLLTKILFGS